MQLTNHLGNVLAVLSDKKFGVLSDTNSSLIGHYEAEIVGVTDYYPFGMPSRVSLTGKGYRFGFNGKENDNDVKGWGNQQDYGMRIYDPKVGRFLSVDPITKQYPMLTPYQYSSNTPIAAVDIDGEEAGVALNGVGWSGTKLSNYFDNAEGRKKWVSAMGQGTAIGGALVVDVFFTKGWLTRRLIMSQAFGAFPHTPASTPEGRAQQERDSRESAANAFIMWGGGKIAGMAFRSVIAAYEGNQIIQKALKDGVKIIVAQTEDDLAYLKSMNSKALYMAGEGKEGSILITEGASRSHLLEEAIHHEQRVLHGDKYFYANQAKLEVEVQNKLLKIGEKEVWSKDEMAEIVKAKKYWEGQLEQKK